MTPPEWHELARARAEALVLDLTAVALGLMEPTPEMLDALASLAAAVVFDLGVADLDAAA